VKKRKKKEKMELLVLGVMGVLGATYLTRDYDNNGLVMDSNRENNTNGRNMKTDVTEYKPLAPKFKRNMMDISETGILYGIEKSSTKNLTNLNDAYKPWSAPRQKPTYSMVDIFKDRAETQAYLEATGTPFYFNKNQGEMVLGTTQQSNPLIEIPGKMSIKGDRENSLAHYPRVYIDAGEEIKKKTSEPYDRMLNAGMPTESETKLVPMEGLLNREWNPWGPGGHLQTLFNRNHEKKSVKKGANQSNLMAPVLGSRFYKLSGK